MDVEYFSLMELEVEKGEEKKKVRRVYYRSPKK